jgi:sulfite oxidase
VCYEMNDEPLPRDHGFPAHCSGIRRGPQRQVGRKIEFAKTEAVGAWQRGLNYKTLPPNVTDAKNVNLTKCRQ